jgi:protein gp37
MKIYQWNPWVGCRKISAGCLHCYAESGQGPYGLDPGQVRRSSDATFYQPLREWSEPALIFTCHWSDFFLTEADPWRSDAWEIIRQTPHLTYMVPTKRPERIRVCLPPDWGAGWPNVWLGVSVENRATRGRVDVLRALPARLRFVSFTPLLESVGPLSLDGIHWAIVGGESGPDFRPMDHAWAREIRDACVAAGIPFFFRQSAGLQPDQGKELIEADGRQTRWRQFPRPARHTPHGSRFA